MPNLKYHLSKISSINYSNISIKFACKHGNIICSRSLSIQNYALINDLQIAFDNGFTIITGETGAGKSILLGALSLLVGQRADASVLLDNSKKCVVEGSFIIGEYNLQNFFVQNELDYDNTLIIRREVLDNGRSRAFVNDSPVNLSILKELGDRLIDIHSPASKFISG